MNGYFQRCQSQKKEGGLLGFILFFIFLRLMASLTPSAAAQSRNLKANVTTVFLKCILCKGAKQRSKACGQKTKTIFISSPRRQPSLVPCSLTPLISHFGCSRIIPCSRGTNGHPRSRKVRHKQMSGPETGVRCRGAIKCVALGRVQVCGLAIRTAVTPLLIPDQQQQIDCQQMTGPLWQPPKRFSSHRRGESAAEQSG